MTTKRILTIQNISCVGQCSLTVALPVISVCGVEACVLPSAVLSTHTGGFKGFTFRDLTDDMPDIASHWKAEGITFDAIYTGYLGSTYQISLVKQIFDTFSGNGCLKIVDPAMADNGKLYVGFDSEFVCAMKSLVGSADYVLPNITEACLLTDTEYKTEYGREYIDLLLQRLIDLGCKKVILTGVSYRKGYTGVVVYSDEGYEYYEHDQLGNGCHGTGDIYASAFTGALMRGLGAFEAASLAADFTVECIKATPKEHWYGAQFESVLYKLPEMISKKL